MFFWYESGWEVMMFERHWAICCLISLFMSWKKVLTWNRLLRCIYIGDMKNIQDNSRTGVSKNRTLDRGWCFWTSPEEESLPMQLLCFFTWFFCISYVLLIYLMLLHHKMKSYFLSFDTDEITVSFNYSLIWDSG